MGAGHAGAPEVDGAASGRAPARNSDLGASEELISGRCERTGGMTALHHAVAGPVEDTPTLLLGRSLGTDLSMWDGQVCARG